MNTIGVSCTAFCTSPPHDILEQIKGKFTHWEIFSEVEHAVQWFSPAFVEELRSAGLTYSLHTSIANTDIGALNPNMRQATIDEMVSEFRFAADMGIDTITVHPGLNCLSVKGCRDRCIAAANDSCRSLEGAAQELGIGHVCIENMPNVPVMLGTTAAELADIVDGTDLGITFDIGHANTMSQIDEMVETFGDRIANVHIHDNDGDRDAHLTIGDGSIDFKHVLKLLSGYRGRYIIESKSLESAVESQKRLSAMF